MKVGLIVFVLFSAPMAWANNGSTCFDEIREALREAERQVDEERAAEADRALELAIDELNIWMSMAKDLVEAGDYDHLLAEELRTAANVVIGLQGGTITDQVAKAFDLKTSMEGNDHDAKKWERRLVPHGTDVTVSVPPHLNSYISSFEIRMYRQELLRFGTVVETLYATVYLPKFVAGDERLNGLEKALMVDYFNKPRPMTSSKERLYWKRRYGMGYAAERAILETGAETDGLVIVSQEAEFFEGESIYLQDPEALVSHLEKLYSGDESVVKVGSVRSGDSRYSR